MLDSTEKLMEAQNQITKLQTVVDNVMKEKVQRLLPEQGVQGVLKYEKYERDC